MLEERSDSEVEVKLSEAVEAAELMSLGKGHSSSAEVTSEKFKNKTG